MPSPCVSRSTAALLGLAGSRCGGWAGVGYALIAHGAMVSFIGGMVMIGIGFISASTAYARPSAFPWLVALLIIVVGAGLIGVGRKAEKAVAAHCIRLHLKRRVTS